ncbi:hypothetical protein S83_038562, partial [Arachis hypogaea]
NDLTSSASVPLKRLDKKLERTLLHSYRKGVLSEHYPRSGLSKELNFEEPNLQKSYLLPRITFSIHCFHGGVDLNKLGRRLIFGKGHKQLDFQNDKRRKKIRKFKESAWKCVYFLSAEVLALSVAYDEPWFTNTRNFWVGLGSQVWPDQKIKLKLKALYMYAAGLYSYSFFALIFWETRRSNFGVSIGHHVATFILIVLSYIVSYEVLLTLDKEKHKVEGRKYYY